MTAQIPVTVLTGLSWRRKNHAVEPYPTEKHGHKFAVIINEFGETGIYNDLVTHADEEMFEMNNGCICCAVRGDLIRIIGGLMKRQGLDGIPIETTGFADPPVAQRFYVDADVAARRRLDAILTVADVVNLSTHPDESHEAAEQIAFADIVLLNKTGLVDADTLTAVEARLRSINPTAKIIRTALSDVDRDQVLGLKAFELDRVLETEPDVQTEDHAHEHDDAVTSISLHSDVPINPDAFQTWFRRLLREKRQDLLRSKRIIEMAGEDQRYVIKGVHMLMDGNLLGPWPTDKPRQTKLVFIVAERSPDDAFAGSASIVPTIQRALKSIAPLTDRLASLRSDRDSVIDIGNGVKQPVALREPGGNLTPEDKVAEIKRLYAESPFTVGRDRVNGALRRGRASGTTAEGGNLLPAPLRVRMRPVAMVLRTAASETPRCAA